MRRIEYLVAALVMLLQPEILDCSSYKRTVGMPYNETGADLVGSAEQIEVFPEFSMVSLLCFFYIM